MMKALKPSLLLFTLVLTIYVMRNGDISVGSTVRRILQQYRPSANLCKGTELTQVYSDSEIARARSFKASLQGMRGGNPMMTLMTEKKLDDAQVYVDYLTGALAFIVPWGALFIISILSAIVITCNWCCIYGCCKNAKCCKCCKEPKDSSKKRIYVFISAIFALAGIGSGIAGLVVSSGVPKGIELTLCSVISIAEDLTYGLPSDHWLGISGALNSIDDLLSKFNDVKGNLTQVSGNAGAVGTSATAVQNQLKTMYDNLKVSTPIARSDPNSPGTYTPIYIANVGPETDNKTMTGMVYQEIDIMSQTIQSAQSSINTAVDAIQNSDVLTPINTARNTVNDQYNMIQDTLKSVNDFGEIGKTAITGIGAALTAIFAATLTFAVFAVGAMLMVGLCKMKSFNKFLHSSWMGFTLMSILGFLLSTILYPLSLVLMETCDVVQTALDDSDTMAKITGNALKGQVGEIVDLCIFGNGDIINYLGLDSNLADFKKINDQFASIEKVMPLESAAPKSITLAIQDSLVADFKSGKTIDATESGTDLVALNKVVNHNSNSCTNIYDRWEFNSVNCTSDKGAFFNTSNADTYDLPNPTCIGFDIWGTRDPISRYGPPQNSFASCGTVGAMTTQSYVETFINKFKSNRISVANIFTNVRNELDDVQEKYDYFAGNITTILTGIVNIKNELATVEASLYDNSTGLFRNMKCTFIKTSLERFTDAMCVGFIGSLYQTSVVIIICSVMSFFGSIFVFCLAKRFVLQDPNTKPKPV